MSTILYITASARYADSVTRAASKKVVDELQQSTGLTVVERDVAKGLDFINESWVFSNFTPAEQRSDEQKAVLALSDTLIAELQDASHIVIATPIYNFGVPATLKAWIDQIARAGVTFNYTENGPVGLLENKKATLVFASGGVPLGSPVDFASPYLKSVMNFIGIQDVSIVNANEQ